MSPNRRVVVATGLLLSLPLACSGGPGVEADDTGVVDTPWGDPTERIAALAELPSVPVDPTNAVAEDPAAAWLGRWLFYDTRLSGTGDFACATCHDPELAFTDGLAFAEAAGTTPRHAQGILNTAYNDWYFWDGRTDSHWAQALGPIEDDREQATTRLAVAHLVAEDPELSAAYQALFGPLPDLSDPERFPPTGKPGQEAWDTLDPDDQRVVTEVFVNLGKAIAAYERQLVALDAPIDTWAQGLVEDDPNKLAALTPEAEAGLQLFMTEGQCFFCHAGPLFTNREFHNIGLSWGPGLNEDDTGRYQGIEALLASEFNGAGPWSDDPEAGLAKVGALAQGDEQLGQFKVPSLRNVAETPPYMHGGHFETLTEVVEFYNELDGTAPFGHREDLMVELDWDEAEVAQVVAFLESLTGAPLDPELLGPPASPVYPRG